MAGFGEQLALQGAGAIMGLTLGGIENKRQFKQAKKLTRLQLDANREQMDYQYGKQMQMWRDTNYSAQMEQLKMAGLNPGLIYGMSGGGGSTTAAAPANTGGHQAQRGGEAVAMAGQAAQIGLMKAQIDNIKADTKVKEATVPKTEAETKSITQGIENQKAAEELLKIQQSAANTELYIRQETQNAVVAQIKTELRKSTADMHIWERNNNIDAETADEKIELIKQQVLETAARVLLTKAQTGKTEQENAKVAAEISQMAQKLKNETDAVSVQKQLADFETGFGKQAGTVLATILQAIRGRR